MKFSGALEGDIMEALDRLGGKVAEDVIFSGTAAAAAVIRDEVKLNTTGVKENTPGIVTGTLNSSIYMAKDKGLSNSTRAVYDVSWNKRTAPHGHLIEFGTSRAPAYPFVRPAMAKMPAAIKRAMERMREKLAEVQK